LVFNEKQQLIRREIAEINYHNIDPGHWDKLIDNLPMYISYVTSKFCRS
jgi:hypothetical protein